MDEKFIAFLNYDIVDVHIFGGRLRANIFAVLIVVVSMLWGALFWEIVR